MPVGERFVTCWVLLWITPHAPVGEEMPHDTVLRIAAGASD
jgi:hypothetical protein